MNERKDSPAILVGNAEDIAKQGGTRGWFIGHFMQPAELPMHTQCVELKWGIHEAGEEKNGIGVNTEGTTLTILIQGNFEITFPKDNHTVGLTRQGDYVIFANGIPHAWRAVTDSVVLTARWPSLPEDQARIDGAEHGQNKQRHDLWTQITDLFERVAEENRYRENEIMQGIDGEKEHARVVLEWARKLSENPSIDLEIAAMFHDIDRVVTPGVGGGFKGDRDSQEYIDHKKAHARRSAEFACSAMKKLGVDPKIIERVDFLIRHHDDPNQEVEQLNDRELNILVSADSFAFFTTIAPKLYEAEGEARLYDKIRFMIDKMPHYTKRILRSHHVGNDEFERIKNRVFQELDSQ